jgi:two-component sensor histidine kinase
VTIGGVTKGAAFGRDAPTSEQLRHAASPPRALSARWQVGLVWFGFVLLVAALAGALFVAAHGASIRNQARDYLDVQTASRDLLNAMLDSETAQRGFLLTGDERYLEPYFFSRINLQATYRSLEERSTADPDQARRAQALRPLVASKVSELENTISLARQGRREEALRIVTSNSGKQLMDELRRRIAEVHDQSGQALARARARLDANGALLQSLIIATIVIGVGLLAIITRARSQMLASLSEQNLRLEERVRERTSILEARTKRIESLLQDMSHRIGNSLSLVTGFLDLQARASKSEEVKSALAAARQRVFSIASAQRRMRLAMDVDTVEALGYFGALIDDFHAALPDDRIAIDAHIADISLSSQDASAFGVILNELLANAVKHAWGEGERGQIKIAFSHEGNDHIMRITDDGRGSKREDSSGGLGKILVESLVQSIQGTLTIAPASQDARRPGLVCTVRAPV